MNMNELKLYQIYAEEVNDGYGYLRNYCLFAKSEEDAKADFNYLMEKLMTYNTKNAHLFGKTRIDSIKEVKPKPGVLLRGQME